MTSFAIQNPLRILQNTAGLSSVYVHGQVDIPLGGLAASYPFYQFLDGNGLPLRVPLGYTVSTYYLYPIVTVVSPVPVADQFGVTFGPQSTAGAPPAINILAAITVDVFNNMTSGSGAGTDVLTYVPPSDTTNYIQLIAINALTSGKIGLLLGLSPTQALIQSF
jgi:hypothetical protein